MPNRYVELDGTLGPVDEEEQQRLIPSKSMDLSNDPRFFNDNVLDKRLAAFTALSVVSSIMVGAACDNFIPFEEDDLLFDSTRDKLRSTVALVGFFCMCVVFFLNVVATMVFGVQFYYVYRLMTASQVGFESAKTFYLNPDMVWWRHFSVKGLIWGMPLFVFSSGCMLVIKVQSKTKFKDAFQCLLLVMFLLAALFVFRIAHKHDMLFRRKYYVSSENLHTTLMNLESRERHIRA